MKSFKKNLTIFLICSSLPMFLITLTYLGNAFKSSGRPSDIPYELFPIGIPFLFGLFGLLNYYIIEKYGPNYSILVGILLGLTFSFLGRFVLDLPTKIFNFTQEDEYVVHFIAMFLYALIFRFIVTPITLYTSI